VETTFEIHIILHRDLHPTFTNFFNIFFYR